MHNIFVVIPAYQPDERLINLLKALARRGIGPVCLIDDGSGPSYDSLFREAEDLIKDQGGILLSHPVNQGKGQALKTAFAYVLQKAPDAAGVVTADSDGQHTPEDIRLVMDALLKNPGALILGVRTFDLSRIPWKSRLGNLLTRRLFACLTGKSVSDTQTGLRGLPLDFLPECLSIRENRFEYEMRMLMMAAESRPLLEVPIETVYDSSEHHQTHFRPLVDSFRVYRVLLGRFLRYAFSSVSSCALDFLLFYVLCQVLRRSGTLWYLTAATGIARVLSATYNYLLNHKLVFESRRKVSQTAPRYVLLALCQMAASALLVTAAKALLPFAPEVACKAVVDTVLFFVSYQLQRRFIFR